jgi:O-antigen ligase
MLGYRLASLTRKNRESCLALPLKRSEPPSVLRIVNSSFWTFVIGSAFGLGLMFLADMETRWIVYAAAGLICFLAFLVAPNKERLLVAMFILSLQVDVYVRLMYGRAGSTEGVAIPLVLITGFAFVLWELLAERQRRTFRYAGTMGLPILALLMTTGLSIVTSSERFIGITRIIFLFELYFVYWLTFNIVQSQAHFDRVIKFLFLTLAIQSVVYFVESALGVSFNLAGDTITGGDVPRPGGTVSANPAGFDSFISPILLIATAMFVAKGLTARIPLLPLLVLMGAGAIGLSFTRAAWAGLIIGFIAICILCRRRRMLQNRKAVGIAIVGGILGIALLPTMMLRLQADYGGESALSERLGLIVIALNVIAAHPLTGVGAGAYASTFKSYVPAGLDQNQWLYTVHNQFLLVGAETGIPGAMAFIVFLLMGFRVALRLSRTDNAKISISAIGWFGGLLALVWQMSWVPWLAFPYNAMLWMMLGVMDGAESFLTRQTQFERTRGPS